MWQMDMSVHFAVVAKFKTAMGKGRKSSPEEMLSASLAMMLKCSDLAHSCLPWSDHLRWFRLLEEVDPPPLLEPHSCQDSTYLLAQTGGPKSSIQFVCGWHHEQSCACTGAKRLGWGINAPSVRWTSLLQLANAVNLCPPSPRQAVLHSHECNLPPPPPPPPPPLNVTAQRGQGSFLGTQDPQDRTGEVSLFAP